MQNVTAQFAKRIIIYIQIKEVYKSNETGIFGNVRPCEITISIGFYKLYYQDNHFVGMSC